jgi:hypothetical protein
MGFMPKPRNVLPSSLALLLEPRVDGFRCSFSGPNRRARARISTRKVAEAEAFSPQREASRLALLNRATAWKLGTEEYRDRWIDLARSALTCSVWRSAGSG